MKGPDRPEAAGTATLVAGRVGGSPGGLGPPLSAPWCRMGVAAGRVVGRSHSCGHKRKHFSGASQQANHFRAALQATPRSPGALAPLTGPLLAAP